MTMPVPPHAALARKIIESTRALLGEQSLTHTIDEMCSEFEHRCDDILNGRGISSPSIAIVGAKGQGKSWVARQFLLDSSIAARLPSGVLSSEATTQLHWVGPSTPEGMDPKKEVFHFARSDQMLPLGREYLILDTPGYTDDDASAAAIAREAMAFSPVKLIVARRDQLRSAIHSELAHVTEGAICVPVITAVPPREFGSKGNGDPADDQVADALRNDMDSFMVALRASAPGSKILAPVFATDFEADGDEAGIGKRLANALRDRLSGNTLEAIPATRASRLNAASERLRHEVAKLLSRQLPQLSEAVRKLHAAADSLPTQTIETVLGSKEVLQSAIRERIRTQVVAQTSLAWFPYRTLLSVLAFTHGAWDRLLLSMSGSIPSIFGTFAAWARNVQQSRKIQWEINEGIRERLNRQIVDRLEPIQNQFYRAVQRLRGGNDEPRSIDSKLQIRLTGVEELQMQARQVFEFTVDRFQTPTVVLQLLGLLGTGMFWVMMLGPIVSIYRQYLTASWDTLAGNNSQVEAFPLPSGSLLTTSIILSILPVFVYAMMVMSWFQRSQRVKQIGDVVYAEETKIVDELKRTGVISLHYDDPVLEHSEYLVNLDKKLSPSVES